METEQNALKEILRRTRWPLMLTWAGLIAERLCTAYWPLWTLIAATSAVLMLGLHDHLPLELFWAVAVAVVVAALWFLIRGGRRFRWPDRRVALARLDAHLPGHPFAALSDEQAIGRGDVASETIWQAHRQRMADRALGARAVVPDLRISRFDPYGLRYIALLGLTVALLFGSVTHIGTVTNHALGRPAQAASGPVWEGWIEPPAYTGLPALYLADQPNEITAPEGSTATIRFYGPVGRLSLSETLSGRTTDIPPATAVEQQFRIAQSGTLRIDGPGGASWNVTVLPDMPPLIKPQAEAMETSFDGTMSMPFAAQDDYGVVGGTVHVSLDLASVPRRYGLSVPPEPRPELELNLPLPLTRDRSEFTEVLSANLSRDVWAHLPVSLTFGARDAADQTGIAEPVHVLLPARRFFDPLASSLIEMRRDLLWSRENAGRVAQLLRAVSYRPESDSLFRGQVRALRVHQIIKRLERFTRFGLLTPEARDALAESLWALAIEIEEGDINNALERMREAQERLNDAMLNGASKEEIARLMQELRDATRDYLRQKAQQAQREGDKPQSEGDGERIELGQQDLQKMMDHIQELMEQGRMAEAQQALEEFQQMMENMQMTQNGKGEGGPGQQALDGLGDTLRDQQDLSDEAFRDLQDQFSGENERQQGQDGQQGQQQDGQQGQDGQPRQQEGANGTQQGKKGLADRQQALRDQLERQQRGLPEGSGNGTNDALDRAGRAMREAEDALRDGDSGQAIDRQSEAMDALREGMQALAEQLDQQRGAERGQGQPRGTGEGGDGNDPLGRSAGATGQMGTDKEMLQDQDVQRRAQELMDEIRRRSAETVRPEPERDYLKRLLDRF